MFLSTFRFASACRTNIASHSSRLTSQGQPPQCRTAAAVVQPAITSQHNSTTFCGGTLLKQDRRNSTMATNNTTEKPKMQYKNLGSSGLRVSKVIVGAMSYGSSEWQEWILDEQQYVTRLQQRQSSRLTSSLDLCRYSSTPMTTASTPGTQPTSIPTANPSVSSAKQSRNTTSHAPNSSSSPNATSASPTMGPSPALTPCRPTTATW